MAKKRKAPPSVEASSEEEAESEEEEEAEEQEEEEEEESGEESESSGEEDEDEEETEEWESESSEEEEDDDDSEASRRDALAALLQPYSKDQLVEILKKAAAKKSSLVSELIKSAESDPVHRKIFVHGLAWDTTKEMLTVAFKPYGQVEECNVVVDRSTGRCKGFGFVLFKTRGGARKALKEPQKRIGSRTACCQLAAAGPLGSSNPRPDLGSRRLFVGNVGPNVNPEKLRAFFAEFGEIEEGPKGLSMETGKFRGFAIFVYKTEEGMKKALQEPIKDFEGQKLECSVFVDGRSGSKTGSSARTAAPVSAAGDGAVAATGLSNTGLQIQTLPVQGLVAQNFNPGAILLGQNPGLGVFNQLIGGVLTGSGSSLNPPTVSPPYPGAVTAARTQPGLLGLAGAGFGQDISTISPSIINAYGPQAALQGLGPYQSSQPGQRSAPPSGGQSGVASLENLPTYFRR